MLQKLETDLWTAEQPLRYFGLNLGTRMTVIRIANKALLIISPIEINAAIAHQIDSLGEVAHIVAPNCYHYLFAQKCKDKYPKATFWAAPGLREKQPNLSIDRILTDSSASPWAEVDFTYIPEFKTLTPSGPDSLQECVFFHPSSRTLILTDTAFNYDSSFPLTTRLAARVLGSYNSLTPSYLERIATKDKASVKSAIEEVLRWDFDRVIVAHGNIVETDGRYALQKGYESFLGSALTIPKPN